MPIASRATGISPSLTLLINAKAKRMTEEGLHIVGFSAGEPDFSTPPYIVQAAKAALDRGQTKYTAAGGILPLKSAVCDQIFKMTGLDYKPSQIVISCGAKHALHNACQVLLEEGDEVVIPAPYWLSYPELVKLSGGVPVYAQCQPQNGFVLTAEAFRAAITPKTKMLILNSPNNPTGAVYSQQELYALADLCVKHGIYCLSDEVYDHLVYDGEHCSIATHSHEMQQLTILVNGVSKTYSMTGWRIGWTASTKQLARAMDGLQSHTTSNPNSIAQHASLAALSGGEDFLDELVTTFQRRRDLMVSLAQKISPLVCTMPKGAFYVLLDVRGLYGTEVEGKVLTSAHDVAEAWLEYAYVAVVPCESFGADGFVRLSYAVGEKEIKLGMRRIQMFVSEYCKK